MMKVKEHLWVKGSARVQRQNAFENRYLSLLHKDSPAQDVCSTVFFYRRH